MTDVCEVLQSASQALSAAYTPFTVAPLGFRPETYAEKAGVICAPTVDCIPFMQAAIHAAGAAGGGDVYLTGKYGALPTRDAEGYGLYVFQDQYAHCYCLLNPYNNVRIFVTNECEITLLGLPAPTRPLPQYGLPNGVQAFEFCSTGYGTVIPFASIAQMPILRNVGIIGGQRINGVITNGGHFKVDPSITYAQLAAVSQSASGWFGFFNCTGFEAYGFTLDDCWGETGAVTPHACCKVGRIHELDINGRWQPGANGSWTSVCKAGVEADGLYDAVIRDIVANHCYTVVQANVNADNQQAPGKLQVIACKSTAFKGTAFAFTGATTVTLADCDVSTDQGQPSLVTVGVVDRVESGGAKSVYPTSDVSVINNKVAYVGPGTIKSGIAFPIKGRVNGSTYDNMWHNYVRNQITRLATAFSLDGALCHDIRGLGNNLGGAVPAVVTGGADLTLNTIQAA